MSSLFYTAAVFTSSNPPHSPYSVYSHQITLPPFLQLLIPDYILNLYVVSFSLNPPQVLTHVFIACIQFVSLYLTTMHAFFMKNIVVAFPCRLSICPRTEPVGLHNDFTLRIYFKSPLLLAPLRPMYSMCTLTCTSMYFFLRNRSCVSSYWRTGCWVKCHWLKKNMTKFLLSYMVFLHVKVT